LKRNHAQSLLGTSFHDPRTQHVLDSHPERAAPLSRRDDERCHAIGSHSVLALYLYLAAYNISSSFRFLVLDHLCSNLSELFHPIPLPCALVFLPPSHRDTTTLSPCWAPQLMTQERIMFSNPALSKPRPSPAAPINATTSFLTLPLHCASIALRLRKPPPKWQKMTSFRGAMAKLGAGVDNELGLSAPHQCR